MKTQQELQTIADDLLRQAVEAGCVEVVIVIAAPGPVDGFDNFYCRHIGERHKLATLVSGADFVIRGGCANSGTGGGITSSHGTASPGGGTAGRGGSGASAESIINR